MIPIPFLTCWNTVKVQYTFRWYRIIGFARHRPIFTEILEGKKKRKQSLNTQNAIKPNLCNDNIKNNRWIFYYLVISFRNGRQSWFPL